MLDEVERLNRDFYLELIEVLVFLLEGILVEAEVDAVLRVHRSPRRLLAHLQAVEGRLRFLEGELLAWPGCHFEAQRAARAGARWRRRLGRGHRRAPQGVSEHGLWSPPASASNLYPLAAANAVIHRAISLSRVIFFLFS